MTSQYLATTDRNGCHVCLTVQRDRAGRVLSIQEARFMLEYDDAPVIYSTVAVFQCAA